MKWGKGLGVDTLGGLGRCRGRVWRLTSLFSHLPFLHSHSQSSFTFNRIIERFPWLVWPRLGGKTH